MTVSTGPASGRRRAAWSLRRLLLTGILLPVLLLIALNAWSLYQQTLSSLHTAYDRTLLASAKSISEQIGVEGYDEKAHLRAMVPYSALEIFEADNQSRMYYRVSTLDGALVSGFSELPVWHGKILMTMNFAAIPYASPYCCNLSPAPTAAAWRLFKWLKRWSCASLWPCRFCKTH